MLSEDELGRVCVVLVRARNPSNIGAVARAMYDFGFDALRVVNEFAPPLEAAKSAVDASAVIARAKSYASVADAVADCTLVVGTTAVGERDMQHELLGLAEGGARIRGELRRQPTLADDAGKDGPPNSTAGSESDCWEHSVSRGRVAILFGSEKTGLSNDELSHCNWLLTIPMHEHEGVRHPSMNLGQAVAVCLYELVRGDRKDPTHDEKTAMDGAPRELAGPEAAAQLERISELMTEVMEKTEYTRRHAHNCSPDQVRRLVRRIGVDAVDSPVWIGFLKQVLWKLGGGERE
jgi:tRNA C32,U32 (ribose-2'-O)-methylase TrmJ